MLFMLETAMTTMDTGFEWSFLEEEKEDLEAHSQEEEVEMEAEIVVTEIMEEEAEEVVMIEVLLQEDLSIE